MCSATPEGSTSAKRLILEPGGFTHRAFYFAFNYKINKKQNNPELAGGLQKIQKVLL
jgi:hypothetical protein